MKTLSKRIRVEVTPRNIKRGVRKDTQQCPIAIAIRRETGARMAQVQGEDAYVQLRNGNDAWFRLPLTAQRFIEKFDEGGPSAVRPFTLVMRHEPSLVD
jgi:hypothetical protein